MDKLKVVLDWFPNTNHTGYLLAQKRGWFKEADLVVRSSVRYMAEMELHGGRFCLRTGDCYAGVPGAGY